MTMTKWYTFSGHNSRGGGWFQFFDIYDWWEETFTEQEKHYILETYKPMGSTSEELIIGDFSAVKRSQSGINLLTGMVGYFDNRKDRPIAYRFIAKAEDLSTPQTSIQDLHFLYMVKLQTYYKDREEGEEYLIKTIQSCQDQIDLSSRAADFFSQEFGCLPAHSGYKQLAIIYEKQKQYDRAIEICQKAKEQGWKGDWEKRVERLEKNRP